MRQCVVCNSIIKGRSDKRFCSKTCSNQSYNIERKKRKPPIVTSINNILQKNRLILERLFEADKRQKKKVDKLVLSQLGFNFKYITGIYFNREQKLYHYVYEFAWMEFSTQEILIIRKKK